MELFVKILSLFLLLSLQATAWGEHGHRTVGYLARMYFTEAGENLYNELVKPNSTFDVSDGAVWPDRHSVRSKMPFSRPWHYIDAKDTPPTTCKINFEADCDSHKSCIVAAIANLVRISIA
jgi:S1/P1 Nuclease